jgi:hypothetical protein
MCGWVNSKRASFAGAGGSAAAATQAASPQPTSKKPPNRQARFLGKLTVYRFRGKFVKKRHMPRSLLEF